MPELPEVEITVNQLRSKVLGRTFIDVWTDFPKMIRKPENFSQFKKEIKGKKIKRIWRRGKNIIFDLSGDLSLLIHQKLTGHLLAGNWKLSRGNWEPLIKGPLEESINRYIHLMFWLSDSLMLALSDLRKFAKVELWKTRKLRNSEEIKNLGAEPLDKNFTFKKFQKILKNKKGKIKQILMDQNTISGIGNIYSDEILWRAEIHPLKEVSKLKEKDLKKIYEMMRYVLKRAIALKGESISDYRDLEGKKGHFEREREIYRREGEKCSRCGAIIKRLKIGARSSYFCPKCQKL